ncbi:angiopoietin-related protein 6-like [Wyeomyia smithii]|uniref:angiopoietin-related protein 6-like n=1 Tax=Wyeomyia smithii TaxID=174621 RepID=UPI0024680A8E|nr:angiopoietin-related protein 6-like [Wyeomyia smithii]
MAIPRFLVRRGSPLEIWSDNGTNFIGTSRELKEQLSQINQQQSTATLLQDRLALGATASCQDVASSPDGVYKISPVAASIRPFPVYCENSIEGGGWTVIHRRYDNSVRFDRTWAEYKNGFGDLRREFWLGLEKMHQITRIGDHELLIIAKTINGTARTGRFDRFGVENEYARYRLQVGRKIGGNLSDQLSLHDGKEFSTQDNDRSANKCAHFNGWWYVNCALVDLNRPMDFPQNGMTWYEDTGYRTSRSSNAHKENHAR